MQPPFSELVLTFVVEHVWDIAFTICALILGTLLQVVGDRLTRGGED